MLVRNTIEEFVIEQVLQQVDPNSDLGKDNLLLSELIVTSLNLLPPLYACSERGWHQQRNRIQSNMLDQITTSVQLAKAQLKNNPLQYGIPLTLHEIRRSEHCLAQLRNLLDQKDLTWKDVPGVLQTKLASTGETQPLDQTDEITGIKIAKLPNPRYEEDLEFYSYFVTASYSFVNVLESVVITETHKRIRQMGKSLAPGVKLDDIVCYVLNRLPPQYVSNIVSLRSKSAQPSEELSKEVHQGVIDSLMRLNSSPARAKAPLPLAKFEFEFKQIIAEVESILDPPKPVSVGNMIDQIEVALETPDRVKNRLDQLYAVVCNTYELDPDSCGLILRQNKDGSIGFHTKKSSTCWTLADQPYLAAYLTLIHFPRIPGLILTSPALKESLKFSRKELFQELASTPKDSI